MKRNGKETKIIIIEHFNLKGETLKDSIKGILRTCEPKENQENN